ncbi:MAG: hypothetical protein KJ674_01170 [Nanoarchaeota archaeon]|nr:hypothetical protein [Nanoarchaeota archaeon]
MKNLFLLTWKKILLIIASFVVSVILHNLVSGLLGVEEPVFFIISVIIIPIYFLICIGYSLFNKYRK